MPCTKTILCLAFMTLPLTSLSAWAEDAEVEPNVFIEQIVVDQGQRASNGADAGPVGQGNRSILIQGGQGNRAVSDLQGRGNTARIRQDGFDGQAVIQAKGRGHNATIVQGQGYRNDAALSQFGLTGQDGSIVQTGVANTALGVQETYLTGAPGNTLTIQQQGAVNMAVAGQTGNGNSTLLSQTGLFNGAEQKQIGDGNDAFLVQDGNGNYASQLQAGNGLESAIVQENDGNLAISEQLGTGALPITIHQTGGQAIIVQNSGP